MRLGKITKLSNGNLLMAWWANNVGRGNNNCTLIVVLPNTPRAEMSKNQTNVISKTLCSSWAGNVNLSKKVQRELGIFGLLI